MKWIKDSTPITVIERSPWLEQDKTWLKARKEQWKELIKKYDYWGFEGGATEKNHLAHAKHYYLTGEMFTNNSELSYYPDMFTNNGELSYSPENAALSMFEILWLHPSRDKQVLTQVYTSLFQKLGNHLLLGDQLFYNCCDGMDTPELKRHEDRPWETTAGLAGDEQLYLGILFPDQQAIETDYPSFVTVPEEEREQQKEDMAIGGYGYLDQYIITWLRPPNSWNCANNAYIFSHDIVIQRWLMAINHPKAQIRIKKENSGEPRFFRCINEFSLLAFFDFEGNKNTKRAEFARHLTQLFNDGKLCEPLDEVWEIAKKTPYIDDWIHQNAPIVLPKGQIYYLNGEEKVAK